MHRLRAMHITFVVAFAFSYAHQLLLPSSFLYPFLYALLHQLYVPSFFPSSSLSVFSVCVSAFSIYFLFFFLFLSLYHCPAQPIPSWGTNRTPKQYIIHRLENGNESKRCFLYDRNLIATQRLHAHAYAYALLAATFCPVLDVILVPWDLIDIPRVHLRYSFIPSWHSAFCVAPSMRPATLRTLSFF